MHATVTWRLSEQLIPQPYRLSVSLSFPEYVTKFLQRAPVELRLLPQIRRQEPIRIAHGHERSLQRVLERLCGAGGRSVYVLDTGELEETLDGWGGDEAGPAGCGDQLPSRQRLDR